MEHDLLNRIRDEIQQRIQTLRPATDEHARLLADLRALEGEHEVGQTLAGVADDDTPSAGPSAGEAEDPVAVQPIELSVPLDLAEPADVAVATESPVVDAALPVAGAVAPVVVEAAAPVAEVVAPVADAALPIAETAALMVETVPPVVEAAAPVAEVVAPVVEAAVPAGEPSPARPLVSPKVLRLMGTAAHPSFAGGRRPRRASAVVAQEEEVAEEAGVA